jgi:hypothetical protein
MNGAPIDFAMDIAGKQKNLPTMVDKLQSNLWPGYREPGSSRRSADGEALQPDSRS